MSGFNNNSKIEFSLCSHRDIHSPQTQVLLFLQILTILVKNRREENFMLLRKQKLAKRRKWKMVTAVWQTADGLKYFQQNSSIMCKTQLLVELFSSRAIENVKKINFSASIFTKGSLVKSFPLKLVQALQTWNFRELAITYGSLYSYF